MFSNLTPLYPAVFLSLPLFSIAWSLFFKNTRVGYPPSQKGTTMKSKGK